MKFLLVIATFLFLQLSLFSQKLNVYGGKVGYGFILPHYQEMRYFIKKRVPQFNVNLGYQTKGNKDWQREWNFPELGFGLYYANLRNPSVLGSAIAPYTYIDMSLFSKDYFQLNFFLGFGSAYLTKPFNYQSNNTNIAIGSHLNIYANINIEAQLRMEKYIYFADFGITHYSNGGTIKPNLGINVLAMSLGVKYKTVNFSKNGGMRGYFKPHSDIQVLQSFTARSTAFSYSFKPKFVSSLNIDYGRYFSAKSRVGAGVEFLYDANAVYHFRADSVYNSTTKDYFSAGVHLSYAFIFGKTQLTFHEIFFLYQKYNYYSQWQRVGLRYFMGDKVILGLALSTHYFNALFIEPSIGIRF